MHGWTFDQINGMTVAQMFHALKSVGRAGNRVQMSRQDGEAFVARHQAARQQWIDRQVG